MKTIYILFTGIFALLLLSHCDTGKEDDLSFLKSIETPEDVTAFFDITNDNSGKVTIIPSGKGAGSYDIYFGDDTPEPGNVISGEKITHIYAEGDYTVRVVAKGIDGKKTEQSFPLKVTYRAPEDLEVTITQKIRTVTVKAKAHYARSFLVFFGETAEETSVLLEPGKEVTHTYREAGEYMMRVVAQSGGEATSEFTTTVKVFDAFGFPIDFEKPNVNYFFGTFGNAAFESKVPNPSKSGINTTPLVGKYFKKSGAESWSGTYSPLDDPIDFSNGNKIKMMVYADPALVGKKINVELEYAVGGTPANGVAVLKIPIERGNEWHELTFDFSTNSGIPKTAKFTQLVLRFDNTKKGAGEIFYIDNIRITFN